MSQGGHLQQKIHETDTLLQQTSKIPGLRSPNSAVRSRSGSSTLIPSEIETAELLIRRPSSSEGTSEEVPLESAIISHNFRA